MNLFFEFHREALDPQIRENVRKTLPMLDEMKDAELREKVINARLRYAGGFGNR